MFFYSVEQIDIEAHMHVRGTITSEKTGRIICYEREKSGSGKISVTSKLAV